MKCFLLLACFAGCNFDFLALVAEDSGGGGGSTSASAGAPSTTNSVSSTSMGGSGGTSEGGATVGGAGGIGGGPLCGDGTIQLPEECDDGNLMSGDGCSSNCGLACTDYSPTAFIGPLSPDCYDIEPNGAATWAQCLTSCAALGSNWHLATLNNTVEAQEAEPMASAAWVWVGGMRATDAGTDWTWLNQANYTLPASVPWAAGQPADNFDDMGVPVAANCTALTAAGELTTFPCGWTLECGCEGDPPGEP